MGRTTASLNRTTSSLTPYHATLHTGEFAAVNKPYRRRPARYRSRNVYTLYNYKSRSCFNRRFSVEKTPVRSLARSFLWKWKRFPIYRALLRFIATRINHFRCKYLRQLKGDIQSKILQNQADHKLITMIKIICQIRLAT